MALIETIIDAIDATHTYRSNCYLCDLCTASRLEGLILVCSVYSLSLGAAPTRVICVQPVA